MWPSVAHTTRPNRRPSRVSQTGLLCPDMCRSRSVLSRRECEDLSRVRRRTELPQVQKAEDCIFLLAAALSWQKIIYAPSKSPTAKSATASFFESQRKYPSQLTSACLLSSLKSSLMLMYGLASSGAKLLPSTSGTRAHLCQPATKRNCKSRRQ